MPSDTLPHFIKFSTDAYGLERLLRLTQACVGIVAAYLLPYIDLLLIPFASPSSDDKEHIVPTSDNAATHLMLSQLQSQLGLTRRTIRLFRFLDAFTTAYTLYTSSASSQLSVTTWLDIFATSFNGMYLLLETVTIVDALKIPGLSVWGSEYADILKIESQRSWLFALVLGAFAASLRLASFRSERKVIATSEKSSNESKDVPNTSDTSEKTKDNTKPEEHLKDRSAKLQELDKKSRASLRKLLANTLDVVLPGNVIGWVDATPGAVALVTCITSLLSGYDVWKRCGNKK